MASILTRFPGVSLITGAGGTGKPSSYVSGASGGGSLC